MDAIGGQMELGMSAEQLKNYRVFFPLAYQQSIQLSERGGRFVHYTSAAVALSIIQNKSVWMRNARTMNDFSEIEYGKECLFAAYKGDTGKGLQAFLDEIHPGFCKDLEKRFNDWLPDLATNTFITSFSEHNDDEDQFGRLSMWRAYGRRNGVALVFNNRPFLYASDALNAYSSPVAYLSPEQFQQEFSRIVTSIRAEESFIRAMGYEQLMANIFTAFRYSVLCTKHPGFWEEKEWRVIYSPGFMRSAHITHHIETVREVPQQVCKIPLVDVPNEGFTGAELPTLLDRIIIGPTEYGLTMFDAFAEALAQADVPDPHSKIVLSAIPIRDW